MVTTIALALPFDLTGVSNTHHINQPTAAKAMINLIVSISLSFDLLVFLR
jgi:hypothetical protein